MVLPSSCYLEDPVDTVSGQTKGRRLTAAGWPAALMVDLRDTDPLEQAVFPEFVGGKEFVRVSHKPDEGKEK